MTYSIPGLKPIPIIKGKANLMRFFADPVGVMQKIYQKHGRIGAVTAGDPSLVCAFGPDYNKQFFSDTRTYYNFADLPMSLPKGSAADRFQINLTAMNGEEHRRHRRLMMPAFHKKAINGYRDAMVDVIDTVIGQWHGQINLKDEMIKLSMLVMMRCMFGLEAGQEALKLGQMSMQFLEHASNPAVMAFPFALPSTPYKQFLDFCERFEQRLIKMVDDRRASTAEATDVLGMLIEAQDENGQHLTDEEVVGQTGLLFVAGHETTAFTLIWTLFLLSQNPDVYANLADELTEALGSAPPTAEQVEDLPLLNAVINESMRILPATPCSFMRIGQEAFQLGPYEMPVGSKVILSPLITHRLPELYPQADQFLPNRWETIKPTLFEFLPFGAGPRMCLGMGFANLEIRLALAMIVQKFRLAIPENTQVDYVVRGITLGPKEGLTAVAHPQDRNFQPPAPLQGNIHDLVKL